MTTRDSVLHLFSPVTASWFQTAIGLPTRVQEEAWPAIASGEDVLVSAPTGTGKTLSAFLVFIDRMKEEAAKGTLKPQLQLIYVSPLKSLAGDIRENLRRPLDGIVYWGEEEDEITVAIRTGDTPQSERRGMVKHPPHILIITPESLYLMLTSLSGQSILQTAKAVIIDELHALIDTKRGAHLMLSLARLDRLCQGRVQRIGLSATIEPLHTAACYLSVSEARIVAPAMSKQIQIEVTGPIPVIGTRKKDPVWEDVAKAVYERCTGYRSVLAFTEGRRYAEKLSYYVNQIAGDGFALVHHGSLSKEQRHETELALRDGQLKLLCATSSMELGIDVGDIDMVLQIGCPRTISSTMQRLGRAGHNPGRVSVMYMYPRTAPESLLCGMTAELARHGGVEYARPPRLCLDVLAQHLVSMAAGAEYTVSDVLELTSKTYSFRDVTEEDVISVLTMLAGDYEHKQEIPVRPRILFDRIHARVTGDAYSRMLAVHAGGTIPDKGLYTVKNEEGVTLGELDEEFVYETRLGDLFQLGAFAWRVIGQNKDTVIVTQAPLAGARMPFWKGEMKGRALRTSLAFGRIMHRLGDAASDGTLPLELKQLGLDVAAAGHVEEFLKRQIAATGILPDDRTIIVEHFTDQNGSHQVMVHSLFGKQVNAPFAILLQHAARNVSGMNIGCVEEEDGFLLYPYGDGTLPDGLLFAIDADGARQILEAVLFQTPVFSINFRYNAARALMMGMKMGGRTPLWLQRLKSTQMMDALLAYPNHPLVRETRRECLEENWDLDGLLHILEQIRNGQIAVRELYSDTPSPMSLPLQWQVEAAEMYEYTPSTPGIAQAAWEGLQELDRLKPSSDALEAVSERKKLPVDEIQLHSLLMMEGDLEAGELPVPGEWMRQLAGEGRAVYVEPGLWIAAEQKEEYEAALLRQEKEALSHIIRRLVCYRGPKSAEELMERYVLEEQILGPVLESLCGDKTLTADGDLYYYTRLYERARKATVQSMRHQAVTQPPERYARLMAERADINASADEQLKLVLERYCGHLMPAAFWESVLLPMRIRKYSQGMLDKLLSQGEYYWQMDGTGNLCFHKYEDIDWDVPPKVSCLQQEEITLTEEEQAVCTELQRRGASFIQALPGAAREELSSLAEKGLVCADSFVPVRQWLNEGQMKKATVRQRVNVRVKALSAGRWDLVRPVKKKGMEELIDQLFKEVFLLCRETFKEAAPAYEGFLPKEEMTWGRALELLSILELTGRVRRGYFIKGMSGAQFVKKEAYSVLMSDSCREREPAAEELFEIIWLCAADPDQIWGKALTHLDGRSFLQVPGTAVALKRGMPVAVMEKQGKVLRLFDGENPVPVVKSFVKAFQAGRLFPALKRIVLKEYPEEAADACKEAGFIREMQDFVIYR